MRKQCMSTQRWNLQPSLGLKRLADAEEQPREILAGFAIEFHAEVEAEQQETGAHPDSEAGGFADGERVEIGNRCVDVAEIDETDAIEDTEEREPDLVVDEEHSLAPRRDPDVILGADAILFETAESRAAAGKEAFRTDHVLPPEGFFEANSKPCEVKDPRVASSTWSRVSRVNVPTRRATGRVISKGIRSSGFGSLSKV